MKLLSFVLFALLPLQTPSANLLGTWTAEKDGTTFVRLELRTTGNSLGGALAVGNHSFDESGNLKAVSPASRPPSPLAEISTKDGVLSFVWQPDNEPERFRFRVIGENAAELTYLPSEEMLEELKDEGIPAPRPIALRKSR
jgi:hypothetical protein